MTVVQIVVSVILLAILTISSFIDRIYAEMGKFLSRDFQETIEIWEKEIEPRLGMTGDHIMKSAAMLTPLALAGVVLIFGDVALYAYRSHREPVASDVAQLVLAIVIAILLFRGFLPQLLFTRTRGRWVRPLALPLRILFYVVSPVTVVLGFLLSVAALAESGEQPDADHPAEAVEALIEAGKEEGILEESDRALVRSAVEFGDKVVRDVMTPRPAIFAVPATMPLAEFSAQLRVHAYSRVPVYRNSLDDVIGIAFLHDMLHVAPDAASTVQGIARPAMFTPETKQIQTLLREMQRSKQHMTLVVDEYGGLAGLVTIEDIVEEIVGAITDEHEVASQAETPQLQSDGSFIVPGNFEAARLGELFPAAVPLLMPREYESTTLGGILTEELGHIPETGAAIGLAGLRMEVLVSSSRRVESIRVRRMNDETRSTSLTP